MKIDGWKYYNHAAVPECAPHDTPNLSAIENGDIWKLDGKPLLVRWTTDFDCGYETNWWYNVRFAPFVIDQLSRSSRKYIKRALKKCYVKKIDALTVVDELYAVYCKAFEKYQNADNLTDYHFFCESCCNDTARGCEYWGGYDLETNLMIGYMKVQPYDTYVELQTAKFTPEYLHYGVSAALYYTILDYYLNQNGIKYISSGSRNVNHKTDTECYKMRHFGYRKAYCKLQIRYAPMVNFIVNILYPYRKKLLRLDEITIIHQINAVLKMEEIVRNDKE